MAFIKKVDNHTGLLRGVKNTSGEVSFCSVGNGLSEVLLDFDLSEDLLELFGVLVEASLPLAA